MERKIAPHGSYVIAQCAKCGAPARLLCTLCNIAMCEEHMHIRYNCIRGRRRHDDASLRLLLKSGYVEVDEVTFIS